MAAKAPSQPGAKVLHGQAELRAFSMSLPMALLRARESVMQHFRSMLRSFGMTEQQWRVLRALSSKKSVAVSELIGLTFLLGPSLSRILKELESRNLIARTTPDDDLRRGVIAITTAGLQLINKVGVHSEAIYSQISSRFGAKKLEALQTLLGELETAMAGPLTPKAKGIRRTRR